MAERALFRRLTSRIEGAWRDAQDERRRIRKRREAVFGTKDGKQSPANLILANINTLLPFVYARNPEFSVQPAETISGEYAAREKLARFLELALDREMKAARLKKKARRCVKNALVSGVGWLKVCWQRALEDSPIIRATIPDAQDNILRIEHEREELRKGDAEDDDKEELQELIKGVESASELIFAEGIVLDVVPPENILVDPGCPLADVEQADWIAQRIWMRKDLAEARFKKSLKQASVWTQPEGDDEAWGETQRERTERDAWVAIWELWDRTLGRVFTWAEGDDDWLRAPYSPPVGMHWHPFFPLILIEDDLGNPVPMVDLLEKLQEAYDKRRLNGEKHRALAAPKVVVDGSLINPSDAQRVNNADPYATVAVDLAGRRPQDIFHTISFPAFDPRMYATDDIRAEMDMISGVQDAMRGAVIKAKTATEASILQQGMSGRVGDIRDTIEEWLGEIARYAASLILRNMSDDEASRIAGEPVILPKVHVEEALRLLSVEIRPGTTGKPDEAAERERWIQLMPQMMQLYQMAQQAHQAGADAKPFFELIKETLRRFDERIDIERFLPRFGPNIPTQGDIDGTRAGEEPPRIAVAG